MNHLRHLALDLDSNYSDYLQVSSTISPLVVTRHLAAAVLLVTTVLVIIIVAAQVGLVIVVAIVQRVTKIEPLLVVTVIEHLVAVIEKPLTAIEVNLLHLQTLFRTNN